MRTGRALTAGIGLVVVFGVASGLASGGVSSGTAIKVPGAAALNFGPEASVTSLSCPSAGNCSAGGYYTGSGGTNHFQAFVASEKNGVWSNAIKVPGTTSLNTGHYAKVTTLSCGSAGNCEAGGSYVSGTTSATRRREAFVVSEKNGVWHNAIKVPGTASLNTGGSAELNSVSCASAGNCSAGGWYTDGSRHLEAFVVSKKNGSWGKAIKVPGTGTLKAHSAWVNSVSCATAGNCVAGGYYMDGKNHQQAFVVSENNGIWRTAMKVPGTATPNTAVAAVNSISCASVGNCTAGGYYLNGTHPLQVVSEKNGVWGLAKRLAGTPTFNLSSAYVTSVSCATAGNCVAGGYYAQPRSPRIRAFVASQTNGVWGNAIDVPGLAALNTGDLANVQSVSCASVGNCEAGGYYFDGSSHYQVFVVDETSGVWGAAHEIPGTAGLNAGGHAWVRSVSCAKASGSCAIGGFYSDGSNWQPFVTTP